MPKRKKGSYVSSYVIETGSYVSSYTVKKGAYVTEKIIYKFLQQKKFQISYYVLFNYNILILINVPTQTDYKVKKKKKYNIGIIPNTLKISEYK